VRRVRAFLDEHALAGALFTAPNLVAWVTGGLEDVIVRGGDGFVWALVTTSHAFLLTQNIEGPRLEAEEDPDGIGFAVATYPWESDGLHDLVADLCDPSRLANDGAGPGTPRPRELQELRLVLADAEQERLRGLADDARRALEGAVGAVAGGMSERELAADIARRLELDGIFPCVLLVGSDERRRRFRHPTVSDAAIERDVLAVIVAVRGGLNVALTRAASIGAVDAELGRRHRVACEVEAHMIAATRPGATYGQALQAGLDAYAALGYPGEWRHHYQGGPIGYGTREFGPAPLEHPNAFTDHPIAAGHACAWNPTVQGAKSEDTFIVGDGGPEVVTCSGEWPALEFELAGGTVIARPAIVER
jgi:antitoxin VapB